METRARKRQRVGPKIGYKKAEDGYIVKLEILGKNNENRSNIVDPIHAKHRCSEAKVLDIFHWKTGKKIESIGGLYNPKFIYTLNETITTKFDKNLELVCSSGIHYFKTLEQAENWNLESPRDGKLIEYYGDGRKDSEYNIINGKIEGKHIQYYITGKILSITNFKDGRRNGKCEEFYITGNTWEVKNYKDEKLEGEYITYYENGNVKLIRNYKNGKLEGKYIEYYENGNMKQIQNFKNNILDGKQEFYKLDGTLQKNVYYKDGMKV